MYTIYFYIVFIVLGTFSIVSVAFNSDVVKKFGRNTENPIDRDTLIQLSMDYVEAQQKVKFSRMYEILDESVLHKGSLRDIEASFATKNKDSDKQFETELDELQKSFGPLSGCEKDSLLNQLKNISVSDNKSNVGTSTDKPDIVFPTSKPAKPVLIEEIKTERLSVPKYELNFVKSDSSIEEVLVLNIMLPKVQSVGECELEISEVYIYRDVKIVEQLLVKY